MNSKRRTLWSRMFAADVQAAGPLPAAPVGLASSMRPLALEQRFMFDGAAAVDVAHAAVDAGAHAADAQAEAPLHALMAEAATSAAPAPRNEVVFIDSAVKDYAQIVASVLPGTEVVLLDASRDGVQQMAQYLQGRSGIDAIHIVSHGADGQVRLGASSLEQSNLSSYAAELAAIGAGLTADGDILLYGCNIAADAQGQSFLAALAGATGADVAASSNATGAQALGGDWVLERQSGHIEAALPFDAQRVAGYGELLVSPSNGTTTFGTGGNDIALATGAGNLGVTARNVGNTGWDVSAKTTTSADIMIVRGDLIYGTGDGVYYSQTDWNGAPLQSFTVASNGAELFDLRGFDVALSADANVRLTVTGYRNGAVVAGAVKQFDLVVMNGQTNLTRLDFTDNINFVGITSFAITDSGNSGIVFVGVDNLNVENVRADGPANTAPAFTGAVTSLPIPQNGGTFDVRSLLMASDSDAGQTLTWTTATGPLHGTLSLNGATAASGGTSISPGGTITYTPAAGYAGTDSFTVRVSDGTSSVTRTITVNVAPATPGAPDLSAASDSGSRSTDNITNAGSLTFSGTSAAGDTTSTVRVFVDANNNGVYDAGSDATATATVNNGAWTVSGLSTSGLADGVYNAYAFTTSATGGIASARSNPLAVTIDRTAPAAPSTSIVLDAGSDSGSSNSDGRTNVTNPTLRISLAGTNAVAGDTAELLLGGTSLGTPVTAVLTSTDIGNGYIDLAVTSGSLGGDGNKTFTARIIDVAGNVGASGGSRTIVLDTTAPGAPLNAMLIAVMSDSGSSNTDRITAVTNPLLRMYLGANAVAGDTVEMLLNGSPFATPVRAILTSINIANGYHDVTLTSGSLGADGTKVLTTRVIDIAGNVGAAGGALTLVLDTTAPSAPSNPILIAASDSGSSNSDGRTNVTNPLLRITLNGTNAVAGDTVELLLGGSPFATPVRATLTSTNIANGYYDLTLTSGSLGADGTKVLTARVTDIAGNVGAAGGALSLVLDTTAPGTPSNPILIAVASDSGSSNSDRITNVTNPLLRMNLAGTNAVVGDTVELLLGGSPFATPVRATLTSTNIANGYYDVTLTSGSLGADGTKVLTTRVIDIAGNVGAAGGALSLVLDTTAPGTPSNPILIAVASDSGSSNSDRITNVTNPLLRMNLAGTNAVVGDTVELLLGGSSFATPVRATLTSTNIANGYYDVTLTSGSLGADGTKVLTTRVVDIAGNVGNAGGTLTLVLDTTAPAAPAMPVLEAGSDNGLSDSDRVTSVTTPWISGTAEAGSKVTLYDTNGTTVLGTAFAVDGTWRIQSTSLALGSHTLSAKAVDAAGNVSAASAGLSISVVSPNPSVVNVSIDAGNGSYAVGQTLHISVTFDQTVTVDTSGGTPTLLLETGLVDRTASYSAGTGTTVLTFTYVVQAGDLSADLDYHSTAALQLNGATMRGDSSADAALDLPAPGAAHSIGAQQDIVIDGVVPVVGSVGVPAAGTYVAGQNLDFSVNFSEAITLDTSGGTPRIAVTLDTGGTVYASYVSGSGSSALVFRMTVASGQLDANGISVGTGLDLNGGRITDLAGNAAQLSLNSVGSTSGVLIDAIGPTATITLDDTALRAGETAQVTIAFNEAVRGLDRADFDVSGGVLSNLSSVDGGKTWTAVFTPNADVEQAVNTITLRSGGVLDAAGNANGVAISGNYAVDTRLPTASIVVADTALRLGETSQVTITFSEAVTGFTRADLTVSNGSLSAVSSSDGGITWTATFTPDANVTNTSNLITLDNTGVADLAGNAGSGTTASNNYGIDTLRPTASIVVADEALRIGETSLVTISFSEAVSGFDNADLSVAHGTLSQVSSSDGGKTWTATFTPSANVSDTSNLITLDNSGVSDLSGNAGTGTTTSNNYAIDTLRPTASIVVADSALNIGETSLVTIRFSEAVTGFTNADLSVANGSLSAVSSSDGGITWTATFTPDANVSDTRNLIVLDNTGVADLAGNAGSGTTDSNHYAIDTQRPTATIVVADEALRIGETSLVTITFSEAVTGFTNADLSVAGGTLTAVESRDGGISWTATFTPSANVGSTANLITLDNTGVADLAGNAGSGTTASNNYAIDTLRPTASIVVADTALRLGETSLVTITFSEAVTGFSNADLTVANGTLTDVQSSDGGITWRATFTPTSDVTNATNLITLDNTGVADLAGNAGSGTTDSNNYAVDTQRPTATIVVADNALAAGETSLVTIRFSEAVTGFTNADLSVANGSLSAVSSSDGGITWTATFTPDANVTDTRNLIVLDNTGVADLAGNTGSGTTDSNHYAIDTQRPTATIVVADEALRIGETSLVTITFSESVTGFTNADLSVAGGTLTEVQSRDGGITWTATFTPSANVTDTSNLITLDNTGVSDLAGNTGTGTTDSNNYAIDTQRPTASIVIADEALRIGETSLVTITFSEAVTGFSNADLTVANGTLTDVQSSDGGVTWTATFTPTSDVTNATNLITLDNTGVADLAGNAGSGSTDSNNYAIDNQRPTSSIVVADNALAAGETSLVTIRFSEAVTGFTNADLSVANGSLSAVSSSDGGITWTATFTPDANVSDTRNLIVLDNTGVADLAGNAGSGTTASNNYAIDTLRPTASIVVADTALRIGETSLVTITFSEAVTGFSNADLSVANGTLSAVSSSDGGKTWTATFTPNANITDAANLITLDNTGVADLAGNAGSGITQSNHYAIDTLRPTATITVADTALQAGETTEVTIAFSEAVTGLELADFDVAHGSLSGLASANGGLTWTAVFTPGANVEQTGNVITLRSGAVRDAAGNAIASAPPSNGYAIDTKLPTASITVADTALKAGETAEVSIVFSEAVQGLELADFSVANGTLSDLRTLDGISWKATLTPHDDVQAAGNRIVLNNAGYADLAGNTGVGSTPSEAIAIDTQLPTASITLDDALLQIGETAQVRIVFNEVVQGLDLADFSVANGTLGDLRTLDGITWTATLTPNAGVQAGANQIRLDNTGYADLAGNTGTGSTSSGSFAIDTQRPTAAITVADSALKAGETAQVSIVFSEAVQGLDLADFTVAHGTLSDLRTQDGITWTATLTPDDGVQAADNRIVLNNAGYTDMAGNGGVGLTPSESIAIDTKLPTASIVLQDGELLAGMTTEVTIVFSEPVQGLDLSDFTVPNGTLSDLRTQDGITWKATLTPANDVQANSNLIRLNNAGYSDLAGNTGVGETGSDSYAVATAPVPSANVASAPIALPTVPGLASVQLSPVQGEGASSDFGFLSPANDNALLSPLSSPLALALAGFSDLPLATRETVSPETAQQAAQAPYVPQPISRTAGAPEGLQLLRSVNDLSIGDSGQLAWKVPANVFGHTNPLAVVSLSMTLADGRPLPQWVRFDARTGTLQVQLPEGWRGDLVLQLTARDNQGNEVKTTVRLKPGAQAAARAGLAEQFQRAALQRAGGAAGQRLQG